MRSKLWQKQHQKDQIDKDTESPNNPQKCNKITTTKSFKNGKRTNKNIQNVTKI